jgi:hypothetical protein
LWVAVVSRELVRVAAGELLCPLGGILGRNVVKDAFEDNFLRWLGLEEKRSRIMAPTIRQVRSSYPEGGYGGFGHEFRKSMREEYLGARRGMVTWSRRGDGADAGFYSYSLGVTMVWEEGKEVTRQYWMAC